VATIPITRGPQVRPGNVQQAGVNVNGEQVGMAAARLAGTAQGIVSEFRGIEARREAEELQRQEAQADAARRAKDAIALHAAEDHLTAISDELAAGILTGQVPATDADKIWKERSNSALEELRKGFSDDGRTIVEPRLQGEQFRLGRGLARTVEKKQRNDVTSDLNTRLQQLSRDYMKDPQAAEHKALALRDTLGPFSNLDANAWADEWTKHKSRAQLVAGRDIVSRAGDDYRLLPKAREALATLPDLDPNDRVTLEDRLRNYQAQAEAERDRERLRAIAKAERRDAAAARYYDKTSRLFLEGRVTKERADEAIQALAGTQYQGLMRELIDRQKEIAPLAAQPTRVLQRALDELSTDMAVTGVDEAKLKQRKTVERVMSAQKTDIANKGGLRAWGERGAYGAEGMPKPIDLSVGLGPELAQQIRDRIKAAETATHLSGKAESPLYPEEVAALSRMLDNTTADQQSGFVAMVSEALPPHMAAAFGRQIDDKNRALSLAIGIGDQNKAALILRGAQRIKEAQTGGVKAKGDDERKALREEVLDALEGVELPPQWRQDVLDATVLMFEGMRSSGNASPRASAVLRAAMGGTIIEHAGRQLPVIGDMDEDDFDARLRSYPLSKVNAVADDAYLYIPGGRKISTPEFLDALPSAALVPVGPGRYVVRQGQGYVLDRDRKAVVVEVR
jgi:hypothetical protein